MKTLTKLALIVAALIAFTATSAHAFPPSEKPHFFVGEDGTCDLFIDPPIAFPVTFYGTIDGTAFSRVGFYGAAEPHKAKVDVTDLMGVGRKHVVVTATGPFLGTSPTTMGDFQCKPEPTTTTTNPCDQFARGIAPNDSRPGAQACTTTTTTLVSSTTSSTSSVPASPIPPESSTSTTLSGFSAAPSTRIGNATRAKTELPFTGSDAAPLAFVGSVCVTAGLVLAKRWKR